MSTKQHVIIFTVLSILALILTFICFYGKDLVWIQFVLNSKSKMQIIAEIPFDYVSRTKTLRMKEQRRNLIAPIYKINMKVYENFKDEVHRLDELLDLFSNQKELTDAYVFELKSFVRNFNEKHEVDIAWNDIDNLVRRLDECERTGVLIEGLSIVRDILEEGVLDQELGNQRNEEYFLNIEVESSHRRVHNRTEEEAVRFLKMRLSSIETSADVLQSIFRILKIGIKPDVIFDSSSTSQKIARILHNTPDVIEKVYAGQVLIDAGAVVTEEDYECLLAYRAALRRANISSFHANNNLWERFFISLSILALMYLFLRMTRHDLKAATHKEIFLALVLLMLNLIVFRFILWVFELGILDGLVVFLLSHKEVDSLKLVLIDPIFLLPYLMPLTLSSILGTLLMRTYIGVLLGFLISVFCCLMLSQTGECLIMLFVITFISTYFVRHSYIRTQVLRAGSVSGAMFAFLSLVLSIGMHMTVEIVLIQASLAFFNCLFSCMFVLTILPFFEKIFKCYTNIGLIELIDYTNPLLLQLQTLAPGTYHHSLMVANLAEQAAIAIRANPFLCRTLSLFHDIGKLVKPEYFTENQSNRNPHDEKTPFMSALIIKSHVREGVAIARAANLPKCIIDGIIEHHGTTVIRYFYSKALKQREELQSACEQSGNIPVVTSGVEKAAFKYDGPRPRSRETLILSIADSIEAASRSLHNQTPQSIQTMVYGIIDGKIAETQFDECRITFQEVEELRRSFYFTLLNMMHSRIGYSDVKLPEAAVKKG